jgi:(E)-4-hydroxy-3-methylbut-2-enyl-diphosphate synthase
MKKNLNDIEYIKKFLSEWFFKKRNKIHSGFYNQESLINDIKKLCIFILKNQIIKLASDSEFPISMHKKPNIVNISGILVGKENDIVIQSMAISPLNQIEKLFQEFKELSTSGAKIIRIAVLGINDANNIEILHQKLLNTEHNKVPIVMCGQYNVFPIISGTNILSYISKLRINPGNISINKDKIDNFGKTIKYLKNFNDHIHITHPGKEKISIRIGVNWGSLDEKLKMLVMDLNGSLPEDEKIKNPVHLEITALILSVLSSGLYAELLGFEKDLIIVSCKTSETESAYLCAKLLRILCDYPIHLGITEAGSGEDGIILSATGLAPLLREKIGNTIRVSITPRPNESRTKEVLVAKQILSSLGLSSFKPKITSCPGCGRTDSSYFRILAEEAKEFIDQNLKNWCEKFEEEKIKNLKIAVMGCLVNGPGEMGHAHIGISLPGFRENNSCLVYLDGKKHCVLKGDNIKEEFFEIIIKYIENHYSL